jgi:hypothetical protein
LFPFSHDTQQIQQEKKRKKKQQVIKLGSLL